MRRLVLWFFPFFVAGILLQKDFSYLIAGAVFTALFLISFIKKSISVVIFCFLFLLLGFIASYLNTELFDKKFEILENSSEFSGYVLEKTENSYMIKNYKKKYKVIVNFYNEISAVPGDYISFTGRVAEKPAYKKKILCSKGMDGYITVKYGAVDVKRNNSLFMLPVKLRYRINTELININKEGGSFVSGLITGYTKELEEDTLINFQNLGISHILAVSGFNLGIIFMFTLRITARLRTSARLKYLLTIFVCLIYTAMGAFEPSVFRAFIMIVITLLAKFINEYNDVLTGITLTAWSMLIINTFYIYNIGFLLSFAATYGIILLNKDIEDKIPEKLSRIKGEIAVSVSAFLTTLPIMLWFRGFFSMITLVVNILIGPFTVMITLLSFISVILYCILSVKFILYPAVFLGLIFIEIINFVSKFNALLFTGSPSILFITIYYLILAFYFGYIKWNLDSKIKHIVLLLAMILLCFSLKIPDHLLKIHYINVGQGQSIFIETPNRNGIVIDTGPTLENFSALKKRVIPYLQRLGYNKLAIVLFTHFHNDHAGDYEYLLEHYNIGKVFSYESPKNSKYKFLQVAKGDEILIDGIKINILYPNPSNATVSSDKNEQCLVMEVNYKNFSMLVPGDVEAEVLDEIFESRGLGVASNKEEGRGISRGINADRVGSEVICYDVFNLSHHGSIKSFSRKMVDYSKIGIAIISVGKNNFGHPSKQVLDYLDSKNITTYRTDKQGSITITTDGNKYRTIFE